MSETPATYRPRPFDAPTRVLWIHSTRAAHAKPPTEAAHAIAGGGTRALCGAALDWHIDNGCQVTTRPDYHCLDCAEAVSRG